MTNWWPLITPGTPYKPGRNPHETLLSIEKARSMLGYEPQFTWRSALAHGSLE